MPNNSNLPKEKILACITIQQNSKRLIQKGYEMASQLGGHLHILHIAKGESIFTNPEDGPLLEELFGYASELGGEVHFESNTDVIQCIASFIEENQITCIVLGETLKNSLQKVLSKNIKSSLESKLPNLRFVVLERDKYITSSTKKILSV